MIIAGIISLYVGTGADYPNPNPYHPRLRDEYPSVSVTALSDPAGNPLSGPVEALIPDQATLTAIDASNDYAVSWWEILES